MRGPYRAVFCARRNHEHRPPRTSGPAASADTIPSQHGNRSVIALRNTDARDSSMNVTSDHGRYCPPTRRRAFTLFEALVAVSITTLAGCAVLTSLSAAVHSSTEAVQVCVARGMARQLIHEVASMSFPLPNTEPATSRLRQDFTSIDDFAHWNASPPVDRDGWPLGSRGHMLNGETMLRPVPLQADQRFIDNFTRSVTVERVVPDPDHGWRVVSEDSAHRRVTVHVTYSDQQTKNRPVCKFSQVFSHVPSSL